MPGEDPPRRRKPVNEPYRQALGLLVRRERSRGELERKLREAGADPAEIETALERLAGQGFQDDARFAAALARTRAAAGYGPQRIRMELSGHGIRGEVQDAALAVCETDWAASAREILARRYPAAALAEAATRRKALALLLRRGFDTDTARAAVDAVRSGR